MPSSLAVLYSRGVAGMNAPLVTVEVHIASGLPHFTIVGLPEAVVRESKDRVRSAIQTSQFDFPARRITVNLAPADLPKQGSRLDLAIAVGILIASHQLKIDKLQQYEFVGELALTGELRPVSALLPLAMQTQIAERALIFPAQNIDDLHLLEDLCAYPAKHLLDVCAHLSGRTPLAPANLIAPAAETNYLIDLSEVIGQDSAKRALEIAAAGGHNMLMCGPPGTGKTLLASRLPTLLPTLSFTQALEVAAIHSLSQHNRIANLSLLPPFRTPHHSASSVALVGGGRPPKPGEVSLAHRGVLFLDELPEFDRKTLETLREPLESGQITIARAGFQAEYPAQFQLVAAMNPCPCGHHGDLRKACRCTPHALANYQQRLSGPLLERIDLHVAIMPQTLDLFAENDTVRENSSAVRSRVIPAQEKQYQRQNKLNQRLSSQELTNICPLNAACRQLLTQASARLQLSARSQHRMVRVARTIADLQSQDTIETQHLAEALSYRQHLWAREDI